jgi:hypothetical protein
VPPCPKGCAAGHRCGWQKTRGGGRCIRAECSACGRFLAFAPQVEPHLGLANASASPTVLLDVLVAADEAGVGLWNDGAAVRIDARDYARAPRVPRARVLECGFRLARLVGRPGPL